MTEHETTVLTDRLHQLADHMTPTVDVVGQVRAARARSARRRRTRITVFAVATATAAVLVGTTAATDLLSASSSSQVAGPGGTTTQAPATTSGRDRLDEDARRAAEQSADVENARRAAEAAAAAASSAAASTPPPAIWPGETTDLHQGGAYYAVFVAVVPWSQVDALEPLAEELRSLGYAPGTGDACATLADGGALPFDSSTAPASVSVDFDTEEAAQQFVTTYEREFGRQVTGVFHIRAYCMD